MPDSIQLIAILIFVASLAAALSSRLNQLPMVGYVIAGILLGPHVFSVVQGEYEIRFVAELGVVLLLFVLGMELPLESFNRSIKIALPVTIMLVLASLAICFLAGYFYGWPLVESLVYGFVISLSSTAVGVKLLERAGLGEERSGQASLGVLIAQDLLFVPMIVTINSFGSGDWSIKTFTFQIILAVSLTTGLIWFLSTRATMHLLFSKWVEKHDELVPVAALAWCFVGAAISQWLGLSPAFGAFLGGLIIGNSYSKQKIFKKIEPLQSVLLMVFFVSIGMLIDLQVIWRSLGSVFFLVMTALLLKSILCVSFFRIFLNRRGSFTSGIALSQIGEFSFVLASTAVNLELISTESYKLLVAVIAISLAISPIWMSFMCRVVTDNWLAKH